MDKTKIIIVSLLVVIFIGYVIFRTQLKRDTQQETEINLQNSTIASKLEAYKKNKEEQKRHNTTGRTSSFYDDQIAEQKEQEEEEMEQEEQKKQQKGRTNPQYQRTAPPRQVKAPVVEVIQDEKEPPRPPVDHSSRLEKMKSRGNSNSSSVNIDNNISYNAVIHGNQTIKNKGRVKMRLKESIKTSDGVIPANTFIYGEASIRDNRIYINISNVRIGRIVLQKNLYVYGSDGISGIPAQVDTDKKIINKEASDEVIDGLKAVANTYTGGLSRIATGVASGAAKKVSKEKQIETIVYDNTNIYLKTYNDEKK